MRSFYVVSYTSQDNTRFYSRVLGMYPTKEQAYRDACVLFFARNSNKNISLDTHIEKAKEEMKAIKPNYETIFNSIQRELCTISLRGEKTPGHVPCHCWVSVSKGIQEYPDQVVSMVEVSLSRESVEKEMSNNLINPY